MERASGMFFGKVTGHACTRLQYVIINETKIHKALELPLKIPINSEKHTYYVKTENRMKFHNFSVIDSRSTATVLRTE